MLFTRESILYTLRYMFLLRCSHLQTFQNAQECELKLTTRIGAWQFRSTFPTTLHTHMHTFTFLIEQADSSTISTNPRDQLHDL